jgi:hypothetical protein
LCSKPVDTRKENFLQQLLIKFGTALRMKTLHENVVYPHESELYFLKIIFWIRKKKEHENILFIEFITI